MMTPVFKRPLYVGPKRGFVVCAALVFRKHIRLVVMALAMMLVGVVLLTPSTVQSVSQASVEPPTNLRVTAVTENSIKLNWTGPITSHYRVERSESMSGPFRFVSGANGLEFIDEQEIQNLRAYVYRVRRVGSESGSSTAITSAPSNMAVGTAISFPVTDWVQKPITAQGFYDVRKAINAVRKTANLPDAIWDRETLAGLKVKASDLKELRDRLGEAFQALQIPPPVYTDHSLNPGVKIKALHIEELQTNSSRGSSNTAGPLYGTTSKSLGGEFESATTLPLVPVHLSVLPNGKILFWERDFVRDSNNNIIVDSSGRVTQVTGKSKALVWDRTAQSFKGVDNIHTNLFCSGHSFLPDGNLFVAGGHKDPDRAGETETNIFDYGTETWSQGPEMNKGRWYPYNVTLSTGEPLIMAGDYWSNEPDLPRAFEPNLTPQIYTPALGGDFRNVAEPPEPKFTQYPYVHLTSAGRVLQVQSGFLDPLNAESLDQASRLLDPRGNNEAGSWESLQSTRLPHAMGSSVLFDDDRILVVGGFDNTRTPTNGAETIDLRDFIDQQQTPRYWTVVAPMNFPRAYHTATILPDGKVLVTGGVGCNGGNHIESLQPNSRVIQCSDGRIMIPELWDPARNTWTKMAPHSEVRAYHSVAALLPDGRVLVGGGGLPGAVGEIGPEGKITNSDVSRFNGMSFGHNNVEIYSPPYLFNANGSPAVRPEINSAPPNVSYGEQFFVGTSSAGSQPKVVLVRLPSVTHGFNQDQRRIVLNRVLTSGGMNVTAPADSEKCPPGHYMLFVLNAAGVPSEARIIRVQNSSLFPTEVPVTTASGEGSTWEQGIEFSSSVDGVITHIRFWKAPGEPAGGHVGRLWTEMGNPLASVTFGPETSSGWQVAELQPHVPIQKNVKYRVTYNIHSVVAKTVNVFCNSTASICHPVASGPLVSWGSYFAQHAGTFPTRESTSNLFADVIFKSPQQ